MILTYKIKHERDFKHDLEKAKKVANYAINNRFRLSTKYVKHFGLKSAIANQILRKYGRNKNIKVIKSVKLIIPQQQIKYKDGMIWLASIKLIVKFSKPFLKINQIEVDNDFVYVSVSVKGDPPLVVDKHIGIDLNTTGHSVVVAVKETGKVLKLGKTAQHIRKKYRGIRIKLQKKGLYKVIKKIKNKESRIVKDLNHKISRKIVDFAVEQKGGITLEDLKWIRKAKTNKSFKYALNSWSFYQLSKFIEYKALLAGVPVAYIDPAYTSKCCSRCGKVGYRNDKIFKCPRGHVDNADVNASFNIALVSKSIIQLQADRDACKSRSGEAYGATYRSSATPNPLGMSEALKDK